MTSALIFKDEHRPYVQTFTATRDGKILAANVRPAFKDEIERLRAQNVRLQELVKLFLPDLPDSIRPVAEKRLAAIAAERINNEHDTN